MALVVPNQGEQQLLSIMLNVTPASNVILRLFTNNVTPGLSTVVGGLTEASGGGYSAITLTGGSWTVSVSLGIVTATYALQTFTFTGAVSVYGYYVTTNDGTKLLWAEQFSGAPFTLPGGGGQIQVQPTISLS